MLGTLPLNVCSFEPGISDLVNGNHQNSVRSQWHRVGVDDEREISTGIRAYCIQTAAPYQVLVRMIGVFRSPLASNGRLVTRQLLAGALTPIQRGVLSALEVEVGRRA